MGMINNLLLLHCDGIEKAPYIMRGYEKRKFIWLEKKRQKDWGGMNGKGQSSRRYGKLSLLSYNLVLIFIL